MKTEEEEREAGRVMDSMAVNSQMRSSQGGKHKRPQPARFIIVWLPENPAQGRMYWSGQVGHESLKHAVGLVPGNSYHGSLSYDFL